MIDPSGSGFAQLPLNPLLLSNLDSLGYTKMTPIQAQSLPPILAGRDVIAQSKTGSGKTAAFGLGILNKLDVKKFRVQSLVLCPTRELADQVAQELRRLARAVHNIKIITICGGMPFGPQLGSLSHGAHIVVGTPGRIEDHIRRQTLDLDQITTLVLDEADRMLEMGFQDAVDAIIAAMPSVRQNLLFSATYPPEIDAIARRIMVRPEKYAVESTHHSSAIQQHFYEVNSDDERDRAVALLLAAFNPESAVIFCNTKKQVQALYKTLRQRGYACLELHGDLEQRDRDQALVRFSNKSASVLVATDVAARGLDIEALDLVINYQLAFEPEVHTHRIGRTGRAGNSGNACTLISGADRRRVLMLEDSLNLDICPEPLPDDQVLDHPPRKAAMTTIQIDGGKKQKVRPGDILGALTSDKSIAGDDVGKINVYDNWTFVAVKTEQAKTALQLLGQGKIKGKNFRARQLR